MRALYRHCTRTNGRLSLRTPKAVSDAGAVGAADAIVVFVHVEPSDLIAPSAALMGLLENVRDLAAAWSTHTIVLHHSTHLATKSADTEVAQAVLARVASALEERGYRVKQTPYGYLSGMAMASGEARPLPLSKVG